MRQTPYNVKSKPVIGCGSFPVASAKTAHPTSELISEPITPHAGVFDTASMSCGAPGLPAAFTWRGCDYRIMQRIESWKESSREGSRAGGELYLRRHCYKLRMHDGAVWTVYFLRQTPRTGSPKVRWFLYSIHHPRAARPDKPLCADGLSESKSEDTPIVRGFEGPQ